MMVRGLLCGSVTLSTCLELSTDTSRPTPDKSEGQAKKIETLVIARNHVRSPFIQGLDCTHFRGKLVITDLEENSIFWHACLYTVLKEKIMYLHSAFT